MWGKTLWVHHFLQWVKRLMVSDQTIIEEIFDTVGLPLTTSAIDRLGSKSSERTRPIRLSMKTQTAKSNFMASLGKLKYGRDAFKRISITDDYTQDERNEIRRWVGEAKERTKHESEYVWKVRGSPKNNLRLIRIKAWRRNERKRKSGS